MQLFTTLSTTDAKDLNFTSPLEKVKVHTLCQQWTPHNSFNWRAANTKCKNESATNSELDPHYALYIYIYKEKELYFSFKLATCH